MDRILSYALFGQYSHLPIYFGLQYGIQITESLTIYYFIIITIIMFLDMRKSLLRNSTRFHTEDSDSEERSLVFNEWNDHSHAHTTSHYETEASDSEEGSVTLDTWNDGHHTQTIFPGTPDIHPALQVNGSRTPIYPWELGILKSGDHIGWRRDYIIWHEAIVTDIDPHTNELTVVHRTKVNGEKGIFEQKLNVEEQNGDLFRFDYPDEVINQNPPELVVERARQKVGESGYNPFKKNCGHFATECKTGTGYSSQVTWAWGKVKETLHGGAANTAKAGTRLGCAVAKTVIEDSVKGTATRFAAAEIIEGVAKGSDWIGAGVIAGLEIAHGAYDIYHIHKKYKAGRMTKRDFQVTTTQRVSEGVVGGGLAIGASIGGEVLGGLIGGVIGTAIAPGIGTGIGAAIGAFIGSVAAGVLGSMIGKALGSLFGRWLGNKLF